MGCSFSGAPRGAAVSVIPASRVTSTGESISGVSCSFALLLPACELEPLLWLLCAEPSSSPEGVSPSPGTDRSDCTRAKYWPVVCPLGGGPLGHGDFGDPVPPCETEPRLRAWCCWAWGDKIVLRRPLLSDEDPAPGRVVAMAPASMVILMLCGRVITSQHSPAFACRYTLENQSAERRWDRSATELWNKPFFFIGVF